MVKHSHAGPFWYPVVAETSDGRLNDQKGQHVKAADAMRALDEAKSGPVAEGNVGGGTGMLCNGFKGGTGTSSRQLQANEGGYIVGALVQCNYGLRTELRISGIPVGREIQGYDPCVTQKVDPPVQFRGAEMPVCGATGGSGGDEAEQGSICLLYTSDAADE